MKCSLCRMPGPSVLMRPSCAASNCPKNINDYDPDGHFHPNWTKDEEYMVRYRARTRQRVLPVQPEPEPEPEPLPEVFPVRKRFIDVGT